MTDTLLEGLIARALAAGADAADAMMADSVALSLTQRLGKPEGLERAEASDLGLRVFIGKRVAAVASSDRRPEALEALVERAIAMARAVPEDDEAGLADPAQIAREWPELDLEDAEEPTAERLTALAAEAEEAALAVKGVTNSEGAAASWHRSHVRLRASNGFAGAYARTGASLSVSVLAGQGAGMETDYGYSGAVFLADLEDPASTGRRAGERAVKRLGARKVDTGAYPVLFEPRAARSLLGHLAGAISGPAIARGTSFLKDRMDEQVFAPGITVTDDPHERRGLRSRPFDAEGLPTRRRAIIEDGRLTSWLLDLRSARKLGLEPTGHAVRAPGGSPSPSVANFRLAPGAATPEALIGDVERGFLVTSLMGQGTNTVTGDYSRGASGFWIENGAIAHSVNEVTIAGNLKDMFQQLTPANDLMPRYGVDAPTVRIDGMVLAGR